MSLIAVFIPILLMGGIIGRLFREFAVTLATAIVISMVVSLTTTPCMCAHVLRAHKEGEKHNFFYRTSEKIFNGMIWLYRQSLLWVLDNPGLMLVVLLLTIALNGLVLYKIPTGFFPAAGYGRNSGRRARTAGCVLSLHEFLHRVARQYREERSCRGPRSRLHRQRQRRLHVHRSQAAGHELQGRPKLRRTADLGDGRDQPRAAQEPTACPSLRYFCNPARISASEDVAPAPSINTRSSPTTLPIWYKWGPILLANMAKLPDLQDVNTDQQNGGLQEQLTYDRVTAARLGQTPQSLDSSLYSAFGQSEVSVIYTELNQYYVVMEVAPQYWQDPSALNNIYFTPSKNSSGAGLNSVSPLLSVVKAHTNTTPLQVAHTGLFPSVTVSFNMRTGASLSDATREITEMEERLGMPATVRGFFAGTAQAYQQSLSTLPILVITALLSVFIVLGILYESLVHPLTIISTVFSASAGAMLALMLFHIDLNVISIIGIILLIGIVKKNAIMMIDFALQAERTEGKTSRDAIFSACMLRFRPIMMTTMCAICGALPLAFGTGTGSELRKPLGITIVGGLVLSQLLTLYTTPVVYLYMDRLRLRALGRTHDTLPPTAGEAVS